MVRSLVLTAMVLFSPVAVLAWAQEASPPAPGGTIELPVDLPQEPAGLAVLRVSLAPGESIPLHPHAALEITVVLAGSATLQIAAGPPLLGVRGTGTAGATPVAAGPGAELTLAAGDAVVVPPGNVFAARAGSEGVTVLIFGFATLAGEGTPVA